MGLTSIECAVGVAIVAIIAALVYGVHNDTAQWEAFKAKRHCQIVARIRGDVFNTVDGKGNVGIGMTPDKTGWYCDDGITYYR